MDNNTVIEGTVKFRDGKKWKSRWCVMRKLSPVADCLHLQLYRDSKDRYKQGQTKASLSLQHFLGVQSGFTLDKESNTIAIICQDVTVVLAFDTRERLIQWQVKIANNLGEDERFLVQISSAPLRAKLSPGPAMLHVLEYQFCLTVGVPPRLVNYWQISQLRRYGVVESRFCFEGGSRCAKGEGLYVLVTDQGDDITRTFRLAAEGKLSSKRRPSSRSASDSPKKSAHGRAETRMSDVSCLDSLLQAPADDSQLTEEVLQACECSRADQVLAWHVSDQVPDFADASSVADFMDTHPKEGSIWTADAGMERCSSCISKLGALSRSSTAAMTPNSSFSPAWTMESRSTASKPETNKSQEINHQAIGGSQQSEVPAPKCHTSDDWNTQEGLHGHMEERCACCPPARPPKPGHLTPQAAIPSAPGSPKRKPATSHEPGKPSCSCNITVNPYDNYDVPVPTKAPHVHTCQKEQNLHWIQNPMAAEPEYYDTPKHIMENCGSSFTNYDIPLSATMEKKQICTSMKKNQYLARVIIDNEQMHMVPCPCQRMMCWPENWMFFPYCRRGNGRENTLPPIHKKNQEREHHIYLNDLSSVYATVDKTKKIKHRQFSNENSNLEKSLPSSLKESSLNTTPVSRQTLEKEKQCTSRKEEVHGKKIMEEENSSKIPEQNYMNSDFLQSLELYENSKGFIQKSNERTLRGETHSSCSNSKLVHNDSKICTKCQHECKGPLPNPDDRQQDDYLMMEPSAMDKYVKRCNKVSTGNCSRHVPGYLPMHPIGGNCVNNQDLLKSRLGQHLSERAASSPSLIDHGLDRRKLIECETQRIPDSCLQGYSQSVSATSSPYLRRRVLGCVHELTENDANCTISRRRTSSADSKTNLNNMDLRIEKSQRSHNSLNGNVKNDSSSSQKSGSKKSVDFDIKSDTNFSKGSSINNDSSCPDQEETIRVSSRSSSKYENIDWAKLDSNEPLVHKRSSSVPSKSSNNRDSLSSNDSGVSSCSLRKRMADFVTDDQSSSSGCGRRYTYTRADSGSTSESFHYSLLRRSKSVDPLQDLAFQIQKVDVPMKSSSAEAEVPICHPKRESKGCVSPGSAVPYMDSRSTSSGTSDMSDYFETLSLSSYSSSDTPDSLHFGHQGVSTMRPRSGKEYQKIDRNLLDESKKMLLPPQGRDNEKKESSS